MIDSMMMKGVVRKAVEARDKAEIESRKDPSRFGVFIYCQSNEVMAKVLSSGHQSAEQLFSTKSLELSEGYVDQFPEQKEVEACQAGCSRCCNLRVPVIPIELFAIADRIKKNPKGFRKLTDRLKIVTNSVRSVDFRSVTSLPVSCALLENDRCTVHDIRPNNCGGHSSIDRDDCNHPNGRQNSYQNLARAQTYQYVQCGQVKTIMDMGLEVVALELNTALEKYFYDPEIKDRWYSGEKGVFSDVEIVTETEALLRNQNIIAKA